MKQDFLEFRQEFEAIEAIGLYQVSSQKCLYADDQIGTWTFAKELCQEQLAYGSEFIHLESDGNRFFGHYNGDRLLIYQLSTSKDVNIVILELKTRKLLSKLIHTANAHE